MRYTLSFFRGGTKHINSADYQHSTMFEDRGVAAQCVCTTSLTAVIPPGRHTHAYEKHVAIVDG